MRYISANLDKRNIRLFFSPDVVDRLMRLSGVGGLTHRNFNSLYLQLERFPFIAPHAVLFRISLMGSGDPGSYHLRRRPKGNMYTLEIAAHRFELQRGIPGQAFADPYWDKDRAGLMVQFPLEALTPEARERWDRIERWRKMKEAAEG